MPFTPYHMGPGILVKSLMQGSFSLMVFGWTQIIMDIQPLFVLINGHGHLHGFSHTFIGASLLTLVAALTGKYLSQIGLWLLEIRPSIHSHIPWPVVFISAAIGSFSHVLIDAVMHYDVQPFYPLTLTNPFLGMVSVSTLHKLCMYSGLIGAIIFYAIQMYIKAKSKTNFDKLK